VEQRTYRASLRRGFSWGFWFLVLVVGWGLTLPDLAWGVRVLGAVMVALLVGYSLLMVCLRVVISDDRVLVRRFVRWKEYRMGDEFGVETRQPIWGSPDRDIVLRSQTSGRSRIPIDTFSEPDRAELIDGIEAILDQKAQRRT